MRLKRLGSRGILIEYVWKNCLLKKVLEKFRKTGNLTPLILSPDRFFEGEFLVSAARSEPFLHVGMTTGKTGGFPATDRPQATTDDLSWKDRRFPRYRPTSASHKCPLLTAVATFKRINPIDGSLKADLTLHHTKHKHFMQATEQTSFVTFDSIPSDDKILLSPITSISLFSARARGLMHALDAYMCVLQSPTLSNET